MGFWNRSDKKSAVVALLDVDDPLNTAKLETSAIAKAAATPMSSLVSQIKSYNIIVFLVFLGCIALLYFAKTTQDEGLLKIAFIATILSFLSLITLNAIGAMRKQAALRLLECAYTELNTLLQHLSSYVSTIDKRTNRFFHCVTTSKITTYYLLNQLDSKLENAKEELEKLLANPSGRSLERAHLIIQGDIIVTDGLIAESGKEHSIAFHNLRAVLSELEMQMEEGIEEIEDQIYSHRKSGVEETLSESPTE